MLAVICVAAGSGTATYLLWTRLLSVLFLPAKIVFALRQISLDKIMTDFLAKYSQAERISIPVLASSETDAWTFFEKGIQTLSPKMSSRVGSLQGKSDLGTLDAVIVRAEDSPKQSTKWYLHLNANGVCMEEKLQTVLFLQEALHKRGWRCNMMLVNYRGIGHSTGRVLCAQDLVIDARAAIQYLIDIEGVSPSNILIHAHSIGGASAVMAVGSMIRNGKFVAAEAPFVLADRTFARLLDVIADKLNFAFNMSPVGGLLFVNLAIVLSVLLRLGFGVKLQNSFFATLLAQLFISFIANKILDEYLPSTWPIASTISVQKSQKARMGLTFGVRILRVLIFASLVNIFKRIFGDFATFSILFSQLGYFLGKRGYLNPFALYLAKLLGWEMNAVSDWGLLNKPLRTLVTCHDGDEMIPPAVCLARIAEPKFCMKLEGNMGSPHMYELFSQVHERAEVFDRLLPFFQQ